MKNNLILYLLLVVSLATSCKEHTDDIPLARVGNEYLYASNLTGLVSPGTNPVDSLLIVNNYIQSWVDQQIMAQKAEDELSSQKKDFSKQVEAYKLSLLIQAYEIDYVEKKMDTAVTDKEIAKYYEEHKVDFQLNSNIIQLNFVKFRNNHPLIKSVKSLLFSKSPNKNLIAKMVEKDAENFFLDDKKWIMFDDITKELPLQNFQQSQLFYNNQLEIKDSLYHYLIVIKDFKIKDEVSPLMYERENIKAVILNNRKNKLLEALRIDVRKKALEKSEIEIFQK